MVAYVYLYQLSRKCYTYGKEGIGKISADNITSNATDKKNIEDMKDKIEKFIIKKWNTCFPNVTMTNTRLSHVLLGMAIHVASDTFSHRAVVKESNVCGRLGHDDAITSYAARVEAAYCTVDDIIWSRQENEYEYGASSWIFPQPTVTKYGGDKNGNFRLYYLTEYAKRHKNDGFVEDTRYYSSNTSVVLNKIVY